jgi:O-antigen ligase
VSPRPAAIAPVGVLAVLALACAWLIPNQYQPWPSYYRELWAAIVLLVVAGWALWSSKEAVPWPTPATVLLLLAGLPLLQAAAGQQFFAGTAWCAAAYLFGAGLAILAGARWQQTRPGAPVDALFAALLLAALLSVGAQLWQWLRLGPELLWVVPMGRGARPFGNLGQPNLLSLLLLWGLIGLWWFHLSGRVRGAVAAGAAAYLLFGLAMAQSRWAWLGLVALAIGSVLWRGPLACRSRAGVLVALALGFVALVLGWEAVNHQAGLAAPRTLAAAADAGPRPQGWAMLVDGLLRRPWAGYGWGQSVRAHYEVALEYRPLHEAYTYAHNVILDLLLWNGIPVGLLLVSATALWSVRQLLRAREASACLLLLALAVTGLHAMLEWPYAYAHFLLPAALMAGVLCRLNGEDGQSLQPRSWALAALVVGALWLGVIARDYAHAEASQWALRFEQRRIGAQRNSPPPDTLLLTQLRAFAAFVRTAPQRGMSTEQLELMRRNAELNPAGNALRHYAHALALNGHPARAVDALQRMCRLSTPQTCRAARDYWRAAAEQAPELDAVTALAWSSP